ncbi:MAG: Fic family protein [Clostridia bacterium]|nr:Fic family protein [Clostridia bacterium]
MSYSISHPSDDCYEGTACLLNKFNIQNEEQLAKVEASITLAKTAELERKPISNTYDFEHYKQIHEYLFKDLYVWAGQIRTVDISKKGTYFTSVEDIEAIAEACFNRLKSCNYFKNLEFDEFIENIVDFYCTTNMLHPFREGNGRTQRVFIAQLIRFCGYDINFSEIDTDELMAATIHSANGITDYLKLIFKNHIKPQE